MPKRYYILEKAKHREAWGCGETTFCVAAWKKKVEEIKGSKISESWTEENNLADEDVAFVFFGDSDGRIKSLTESLFSKLTGTDAEVFVWCHYGNELPPGKIPGRWNTQYSRLEKSAKEWVKTKLTNTTLRYPVPFSHGQTWAYEGRFKEAEKAVADKKGTVAIEAFEQAWKDADDYFGTEREISVLHAGLSLRMAVKMIIAELDSDSKKTEDVKKVIATELSKTHELPRLVSTMSNEARDLGVEEPFGVLATLRSSKFELEDFYEELEGFIRGYDERSRELEDGHLRLRETRDVGEELDGLRETVSRVGEACGLGVKDSKTGGVTSEQTQTT